MKECYGGVKKKNNLMEFLKYIFAKKKSQLLPFIKFKSWTVLLIIKLIFLDIYRQDIGLKLI